MAVRQPVIGAVRRRFGVISAVLTAVLGMFVVAVAPGAVLPGGVGASGEGYVTVSDEIDVPVDVEVDLDGADSSQPAWYEVLAGVLAVARSVGEASSANTGETGGGGTGSEGGTAGRDTTSGDGQELPSVPPQDAASHGDSGAVAPAESPGASNATPAVGVSPSAEPPVAERSGATPVARSVFERGAWETPMLTASYVLVGLLVGFALAGPRLLRKLATWPAPGNGRHRRPGAWSDSH